MRFSTPQLGSAGKRLWLRADRLAEPQATGLLAIQDDPLLVR